MDILHHYNQSKDHSCQSATVLVDFVVNKLEIKPKSVIDVGCGLGQWLKVFKDSTNCKILGIDGPHVPEEESFIPEKDRLRVRLEEFIDQTNFDKYELAVCLEVAEHLPCHSADLLVRALSSLSDLILFSAAIPGQTGENHINEQPHHFWLSKFQSIGFLVSDPFRERFWNHPEVNWWYSQNMFLLYKDGSKINSRVNHHEYNGNMYVHPTLLEFYRESSSREASDQSAGIARKVLRKLLFKNR
jgi:hypothetical protein